MSVSTMPSMRIHLSSEVSPSKAISACLRTKLRPPSAPIKYLLSVPSAKSSALNAQPNAPLQLECLIRPLIGKSRSDSMRIRATIPINFKTHTLHPLEIRRPNLLKFLAENSFSIHLPQHQRKIVSGVADVFHKRPDSAGQTVVTQPLTHLQVWQELKIDLHPLPILVSNTRPASKSQLQNRFNEIQLIQLLARSRE